MEQEKKWLDRRFDDNLVVRDLVLLAILFVPFAIAMTGMGVWMGVGLAESLVVALGAAALFTVLWVGLMEPLARYRGSSLFRSVGEDPLE